jgi:energy-converting hydrogenase B subunit D
MSGVQVVALVVVALGGTAVVFARDPARQALMAGIFGFSLAILFLAFQAPDVALSQIVVGAIALPAMIIYALRKVQRREDVERGRR